MDKSNQVDILLGTYNGAPFLEEQLHSLFNQSYPCTIIVSDDCSTDQTREILNRYKDRLTIIHQSRQLGVVQNFSHLLERSTAPYIMCCDQDDIWDSEKVAKTLALMKKKEAVLGADTPLLIHSDLEVVDREGKTLHPSYWRYTRIFPDRPCPLSYLLMQNVVTACATMVNRALLTKALPLPKEALMHDWWLALVATLFGEVVPLPFPLIKYRQHGRNVVGAKKFASPRHLQSALARITQGRLRKMDQVNALLSRYGAHATLTAYLKMQQSTYLLRPYYLFKHRFYKQGLLRNLLSFFVRN